MRLIVAIAVFLFISSTADAATPSAIEKRHTKAYNYCLNNGDAARGVQPAMNACAAVRMVN